MNAHEAITAHIRKQNAHLERFLELDEARERAIEKATALCAAGQPFSTDEINEWSARINAHARNGISPTRVIVTQEMIREHALRSQS
ncbi:DUF2533 family protein [Paenibacillus cremeus]|uniref:DUF2533 family protein n=1 Tax=Paenibacillus cremeus TaxID=2163881 RepID=A0A559K551_9BACL|nr:DUF2533 family protein [Paenibacillus cremeus]TVY07265.1 DUF2533 family protein [Paenibacillus cremeus]